MKLNELKKYMNEIEAKNSNFLLCLKVERNELIMHFRNNIATKSQYFPWYEHESNAHRRQHGYKTTQKIKIKFPEKMFYQATIAKFLCKHWCYSAMTTYN